MRMAYWMRIAVGALLGAGALVGLWLGPGIGWLTATVAALAALIGFLGSYFVVSADRPAEGYEQVLFDRPNTLVALALVVVFAGAGFGTGLLGGDSGPDPADNVYALRADYQAASDAWGVDSPAEDTLATLETLRTESDLIAGELALLPEGDVRTHLEAANDAIAFSIDALKVCAQKETRSCIEARINAADAESALQKYAALAG